MKKVVLVTGSSNGLGSAVIETFAKQGYDVVINYNNDFVSAEKLKQKVENKYNVKVLVIKCDISNEDQVKEMYDKVINTFKRIDVVVNNAAVEICSDIKDKNYDSFRKVLDVNVIGTFLVSKYFGELMFKNKTGKIINISSNNAIDKYDPSTMEYDASKSAVISLTKNFAKEYAPYINVNCIAPGWIKTDKIIELDKSLDNKFIKSESEKILLKRFATPEEISKVILFLASNDSSYINGEVIRVDGGCDV